MNERTWMVYNGINSLFDKIVTFDNIRRIIRCKTLKKKKKNTHLDTLDYHSTDSAVTLLNNVNSK